MIAFVAGGTGLVGSELIKILEASPDISKIYALTRKDGAFKQFSKVEEVSLGENMEFTVPKGVTQVFSCLGTTMKKAGSKEAFKKVDHDLVIKVAKAGLQAGAYGFHMVSALGADYESAIFYNKVKGQTEEDIKKLGYKMVGIYQPSLLLGDRGEFRFGEKVGIALFKVFSFLFIGSLKKYKGIKASAVARSMYETAKGGKEGISVIVSAEMQQYA